MADILAQIDDAIRRNVARFDPLGAEAWDQDRVDRWGDGMRVRPARAGIGEEAVPAEATVMWLPPGSIANLAAPTMAELNVGILLRAGCCDLHNVHCEQGGDECCNDCAEAVHFEPGHGGRPCVLESNGNAPAAGRMPFPAVERDSTGELAYVPDRQPNGEPCEGCRIAPCEDGQCACQLPAPRADRVADAFRAEVLRQGLAPCEIEIDDQPEWLAVDDLLTDGHRVWVDETHTFQRVYLNERIEAPRPFLTTALDSEADALAERISASLAAALEAARDVREVDVPCCTPMDAQHTLPNGHSVFCRDRYADADSAAPDGLKPRESASPPVSWWRRFLPGGTR